LITYRPQIQREYLRSIQQQPLSNLFSFLPFSTLVCTALFLLPLSCFCPTDKKPAAPAESVRLSLALAKLAAQAAPPPAATTEIESEREVVRWKNGKEGKKQIYTQMEVEFDVGKEGRDIWPQAVMAVTFVPGSTRFQPLFPAQF
jgi:hypothetical protein